MNFGFVKKLAPAGDVAVLLDLRGSRGGMETADRSTRCLAGGQVELASDSCASAAGFLGFPFRLPMNIAVNWFLVCPGETRAETLKLELENLVAAVTRTRPRILPT